MYLLTFILGILCGFILFEILKNYVLLNVFQRLEMQMLLIAMNLIQYKYHAIKIIEIAYSSEPDKKEECEKIVSKIHEKFDGYGDIWIQNLIAHLPYKTQYINWKTAIQYAEQLINKDNEVDSGKS